MLDDFIKSHQDFTHHFTEMTDEEMDIYDKKAKKFWIEIEKIAEKYEVTCDYVLYEFILL